MLDYNIICFFQKLNILWKMESHRLSQVMLKPKLLYSIASNISVKRSSHYLLNSPYELRSFYRTNAMIIFCSDSIPEKQIFMIFTPCSQNLWDIGCWNFTRLLFSMESWSVPPFMGVCSQLRYCMSYFQNLCSSFSDLKGKSPLLCDIEHHFISNLVTSFK